MPADTQRSLTIGLLRLTDAAPVIVAKELGLFGELGLDVTLSVEPSWANIADKLSFGRLDAAVILPPLAFAVTLGVRGVARRLVVPMSLSLNGNSIVLANTVAAGSGVPGLDAIGSGRALAYSLAKTQGRLRLAVVHAFSNHNLLLRYWLAASGIDPDRQIEFSVVPPADMINELRAGRIDGFCAGPPWGDVAAQQGIGHVAVGSSQVWSNHPEKCLAVRSDWADANRDELTSLLRAIMRAARFCDNPRNARSVAELLARTPYLAVAPALLQGSLPADKGDVRPERPPEFSTFFAHAANFPWRSHAAWFLEQLIRWGYLRADIDCASLITDVYRPDLLRAAALAESVSFPVRDWKREGEHAKPWSIDGNIGAIEMRPDLFCDGAIFDPEPSRNRTGVASK